jgi:hypothetical protein
MNVVKKYINHDRDLIRMECNAMHGIEERKDARLKKLHHELRKWKHMHTCNGKVALLLPT